MVTAGVVKTPVPRQSWTSWRMEQSQPSIKSWRKVIMDRLQLTPSCALYPVHPE